MEDLKSNAEIRNESGKLAAAINSILESDQSRRKIILSPFFEPWTRSVTIGELVSREIRWREVAPNPVSRLRCLQTAHLNNLLEWPQPEFLIIRVRPENLFDPPKRVEMLDVISPYLGEKASVGDVIKIDGAWAVAVSGAGEIPEIIPGFAIRTMNPEEIADLPAVTQTGRKKVSVASPRIDAVAAQVLKPSREQIKKHLESGGVLLNYKIAGKAGTELVPGDIVSVRGGGRFRFEGIIGESKKGRVYVEIEILNGA